MRCERCVLEFPEASASLDDFHEKLGQCNECPLQNDADASPVVWLLVQRHKEAARALRKIGQRARAAEAHVRDLGETVARQESKILVIEEFQKASAAAADAALQEKLSLLEQKEAAIVRLGAPIIHVLDGVVALPLIGELDGARAESMTATLLDTVAQMGATHVVLDLTGISSLNAETAELLLRVAQAVRLLGAEIMLTGMRADLARTVVTLDVGLGNVRTLPTLKEAVRIISRDKRHERSR